LRGGEKEKAGTTTQGFPHVKKVVDLLEFAGKGQLGSGCEGGKTHLELGDPILPRRRRGRKRKRLIRPLRHGTQKRKGKKGGRHPQKQKGKRVKRKRKGTTLL